MTFAVGGGRFTLEAFASVEARNQMNKNRLEAFSDGVLAIIITVMVIELHTPAEPTWHALFDVLPTVLSYLLSFVFVGIYWNNHHHMLHLAGHVNGGILWANLHLLFWLSLVPFTTRWMGDTGFVEIPVLTYGVNLLLAAIAYFVLRSAIIREQGADGPLAQAVGRDWKGKLSPLLYVLGLVLAGLNPGFGMAAYALVALIWLIPDRRLELFVRQQGRS